MSIYKSDLRELRDQSPKLYVDFYQYGPDVMSMLADSVMNNTNEGRVRSFLNREYEDKHITWTKAEKILNSLDELGFLRVRQNYAKKTVYRIENIDEDDVEAIEEDLDDLGMLEEAYGAEFLGHS